MSEDKDLTKWYLEELSCYEDIDNNEIEILGEDDQCREACTTADITDIACRSLNYIKHLESHYNNSKSMQVKYNEALTLLNVADCPQCKDKSGAYYDNYGEVCQCQWCYEVSKLPTLKESEK